MADGRVAHRAAALAWLAPSAPRLAALAGIGPARLTDDPASALLLLRFTRPTPTIDTVAASEADFQLSGILEAAATYLEADQPGWTDPTQPTVARIQAIAKLIAIQAESLAATSKLTNPAAAYLAGLLAPLGWLACATTDVAMVQAVLHDPEFAGNPAATEQRLLGLPMDGVTRRLVHNWRLPDWIAKTLSTLRLPVHDAVSLGADNELAKVLRFAIEAVESREGSLGLLGHASSDFRIDETILETTILNGLSEATDPRTVALLPALLRAAAQTRRQAGAARASHLEEQIDRMQSALAQSRADFDDALRDAKLEAVAELAAGAGHEINNPLAVISGNAQLLRTHEEDPDRRRSLDVIVRQTGRIAELLQDLMQFARPAKAQIALFPVRELLTAVEREVSPLAALKAVTLRLTPCDAAVQGDPRQLRKALGNLVRNAIEVSSAGSVVRIIARQRSHAVELIVEDTGPGPCDESLPHLFDPFYSGRSAGRGRGLGLSTAWQYAKQNGGDLQFERTENGPTRFVLSLPAAEANLLFERQSA